MSVLVCARPGCGCSFVRRTSQRYCSTECRQADRRCCKCRMSLPDGQLHGYCRECSAALARVRRERSDVRELAVRSTRFKAYGITGDEYERMHAAQAGVCAICGEPETAERRGIPKTLAVDHDHVSGVVRGLLCQRCNTAIGLMGDDPDRLRAAADYLGGRA